MTVPLKVLEKCSTLSGFQKVVHEVQAALGNPFGTALVTFNKLGKIITTKYKMWKPTESTDYIF